MGCRKLVQEFRDQVAIASNSRTTGLVCGIGQSIHVQNRQRGDQVLTFGAIGDLIPKQTSRISKSLTCVSTAIVEVLLELLQVA